MFCKVLFSLPPIRQAPLEKALAAFVLPSAWNVDPKICLFQLFRIYFSETGTDTLIEMDTHCVYALFIIDILHDSLFKP